MRQEGIDPNTHKPLPEVENDQKSPSFSSETNQDFFFENPSDFSDYLAFQKLNDHNSSLEHSVSIDNSLCSMIPTQFNIDDSVSNAIFEAQISVKPSIVLFPPLDNTLSSVSGEDRVKMTEPNWESNCGSTINNTSSYLHNPGYEEMKWSDQYTASFFTVQNQSINPIYVKSETDFNSNTAFPWGQSQAIDVFPKDLQRVAVSFGQTLQHCFLF